MKDPWFPLVALFTVLLAAWLGVIGPIPPPFTNWIERWQTLIGAAAALVAAWIAYCIAMKQIRQNDELERVRRNRKHAAMRAMLPLALAQISDYAQRSVHQLLGLIAVSQSHGIPKSTTSSLTIESPPYETLEALADFIEFSDDIDVNLMEATVAWIQIHHSRVSEIIRDSSNPQGTTVIPQLSIEGSIIDAASIYAGASAYFEYARRRQDMPPTNIDWQNVRSALQNLKVWSGDPNYDRIYGIIDGREKVSSGPFDRLKP